ncbi:motility associated factor glycosyltransferase family protein [Jeotgalibacillus salarius]|uniref:DUF115 domain-containing protein n=1 Tax=Jeotgalibacillus salarius TaxID=546023 RepID=A0A4Y8LR52_9BACL|nr:6-hydroxymethylpterin diphosphokinase MptE-like protein [Jeotgalibacillus salarius]TFE03939.1 DUF115 domain-containing protein [Jeotgalibacillus salarius]
MIQKWICGIAQRAELILKDGFTNLSKLIMKQLNDKKDGDEMLIQNINFLRKSNRNLRDILKQYEQEENRDSSVEVLLSKKGLPTIKYHDGHTSLFLHSKYDPLKESDQIFNKYNSSINECKNIIFFGVGMGYHIKLIMEKYPDRNYFLYEPNPTILYHFLSVHALNDTFSAKRYKLYTAENKGELKNVIKEITKYISGSVFLISHPSYERVFKEEHNSFLASYNEELKAEITNVKVSLSFQRQWLLNSIKNFKHTLNTPNILDIDNNFFKEKPVIIVSAGPSLSDEIESLQKIKREGLGYIFAVGSANKVLINNNIEPDAVCTYDPQMHNHEVFKEMIDNNIEHIPMIYGTTVGYPTLEKYKGPKLHMVISQDNVTPYLLNNPREKVGGVDDAPSIAIVILQLLNKIEASPIILAGQNFAYRDQDFYAKGIEYNNRAQKLSQNDYEKMVTVKSVSGQDIYTSEGFLRMKETMEKYLRLWNRTDVINTTVGGANIEGTTYIPFEDVITEFLTESVVNKKWSTQRTQSSLTAYNLHSKFKKLERCHSIHVNTIKEIKRTINEIDINNGKSYILPEKQFAKLDNLITKLEGNDFHKVFIKPIVRVEHEQIIMLSKEISYINNAREKSTKVVEGFGKFINSVDVNTSFIEPAFFELKANLGV